MTRSTLAGVALGIILVAMRAGGLPWRDVGFTAIVGLMVFALFLGSQ